MRYTPDDPPFNRAVMSQIEGTNSDERVVFFGNDNEVREVVYVSEFESGEPRRIRARLTEAGNLKAILHVTATAVGSKTGHGPRYSTVEYLPDGQYYVRQHTVRPSIWVSKTELIEAAVEATQTMFSHTGKEE